MDMSLLVSAVKVTWFRKPAWSVQLFKAISHVFLILTASDQKPGMQTKAVVSSQKALLRVNKY